MILPKMKLHCEMAKGMPTRPAPTMLLHKLKAAPIMDVFFSSSTSFTDLTVPLGVVTIRLGGGFGAKKGD